MAGRKDDQSLPRLSDEELEYYGELYLGCAIREAGVDFGNFLINPEYYLRRYAKGRWRAGDGNDRRKGLRRYLRFRQVTQAAAD